MQAVLLIMIKWAFLFNSISVNITGSQIKQVLPAPLLISNWHFLEPLKKARLLQAWYQGCMIMMILIFPEITLQQILTVPLIFLQLFQGCIIKKILSVKVLLILLLKMNALIMQLNLIRCILLPMFYMPQALPVLLRTTVLR